MSTSTSLTERQRFWLEHIRACGNGSLKAYATAHQLDIRLLYEAKSRLKRKGALESPSAPRFVRVRCDEAQVSPAVCRIHLRNGTLVEVACAPEHWPRLLEHVAALS